MNNADNIDISLSKKDKDNKVLIGIKIRAISNNEIRWGLCRKKFP